MRRILALSLLSLSLLSLLVACKDKEPAQQSQPKAESSARSALKSEPLSGASNFEARDGIFAVLPKDAAAFFYWDLSGKAFGKLIDSRWGKTYLARTQNITAQQPQLADALKKSGFPIDNPTELRKQVREALVFLSRTGKESVSGGVVFRTTSASDGAKTLASLKGALAQSHPVTDTANGGFRFPVKAKEGQEKMLYASSAGDKILIGDMTAPLNELLAANSGKDFRPADLPLLAKGENGDQIAFGYLNAQVLEEEKPLPVSGAYVSIAMTDRPMLSFKMKRAGNVGTAVTSAPSKALLATFPENPLLFATLQAGEVRSAVEENSAEAKAALNDSQFAALRSIQQMSLGVRPAGGPMQAMLPIPEVIIAAETASPSELAKTLVDAALGALKGYGVPAQAMEKNIAGRSVKVVPGVFGLSLHVTSTEGAVIASTSETLLQSALQRQTLADPLTGVTLEPTTRKSFQEGGLGKLYLNFPEVSKLLGSVKGMAGMTGAQNAEESAATALSEENLKALADLGVLVSTLTQEGEIIRGELTYL